jgi:hypothetical protein
MTAFGMEVPSRSPVATVDLDDEQLTESAQMKKRRTLKFFM